MFASIENILVSIAITVISFGLGALYQEWQQEKERKMQSAWNAENKKLLDLATKEAAAINDLLSDPEYHDTAILEQCPRKGNPA